MRVPLPTLFNVALVATAKVPDTEVVPPWILRVPVDELTERAPRKLVLAIEAVAPVERPKPAKCCAELNFTFVPLLAALTIRFETVPEPASVPKIVVPLLAVNTEA